MTLYNEAFRPVSDESLLSMLSSCQETLEEEKSVASVLQEALLELQILNLIHALSSSCYFLTECF